MVETAGEGKDKIGEEKREDGHCRGEGTDWGGDIEIQTAVRS